jgi:predicted DNA-binding protein
MTVATVMNYPLRLPADLAKAAGDAARARSEPLAVWIREAIRQRLEREAG